MGSSATDGITGADRVVVKVVHPKVQQVRSIGRPNHVWVEGCWRGDGLLEGVVTVRKVARNHLNHQHRSNTNTCTRAHAAHAVEHGHTDTHTYTLSHPQPSSEHALASVQMGTV
jgi:hypothetical protein